MNVDPAIFIMVGIAFSGVGTIILFTGIKEGVTFGQLMAQGRRVYDDLEAYFSSTSAKLYTVFQYVGVGTVLVGVFLLLF